MMEGHVASELSRMVQANRDEELERTQGTIDSVAEELVRRTDILGRVVHQVAENTGQHNRKSDPGHPEVGGADGKSFDAKPPGAGQENSSGRGHSGHARPMRQCTGSCIKN